MRGLRTARSSAASRALIASARRPEPRIHRNMHASVAALFILLEGFLNPVHSGGPYQRQGLSCADQVAHLAFFGGGGSGVTSSMAAGYCRMKSFESDAGASSQASYNPSGMITTMRLALRLGWARRVGPVHVLYQVVIVGVSIVNVLTYPGDFHGWQKPARPRCCRQPQ